MAEYFVKANSFAAPFFSDESTQFIEATTAKEALERFASNYTHPCGLYAAAVWAHSDDFHKGRPALAKWISNHAKALTEETGRHPACSVYVEEPGRFRVNDAWFDVEDPKGGTIEDGL